MKKAIFAIIFGLPACLGASAVETTAGKLEEAMDGTEVGTVTSLTLTGTVDARDFSYILENMPQLTSLDLSGVTVEEYSDKEAVFANYTYYAAGELPKMGLAGSSLSSLVLPSGLTSIGDCALTGCASLTAVEIPQTVTEIGAYAFSGCSSLATVTGGSAVATLGDYAFSQCASLSSVASMPLADVPSYAFVGCSSLSAFPFPASLTAVGEGAFKGCPLASLDLSGCSGLTAIGAWAFADNASLASLSLPGSVTSIGDGAFFYNTALQAVSLPAGLTKVNDYAFMGGSLVAEATLPDGVEEIGAYAFSDWGKIVSFIIPQSVTSIGERAFRRWVCLGNLVANPTTPPTLGDEVWEGVTKGEVTLTVPEASENAYRAADQWKDFFGSSLVETIGDEALTVITGDDKITIRSSVGIAEARLYDLSGIMLSVKANQANETVFDLSHYSGMVYVVRCALDNGTVKFLKIGRK